MSLVITAINYNIAFSTSFMLQLSADVTEVSTKFLLSQKIVFLPCLWKGRSTPEVPALLGLPACDRSWRGPDQTSALMVLWSIIAAWIEKQEHQRERGNREMEWGKETIAKGIQPHIRKLWAREAKIHCHQDESTPYIEKGVRGEERRERITRETEGEGKERGGES